MGGERTVYLISFSNHALTYEAETADEVLTAVGEILRRQYPLHGQITIEQHIMYPASALKEQT